MGGHGEYFILLQLRGANVHIKLGMTQNHDLTLHFPECSHSERVAEDVMADFYSAFVFLLLPLCHLLRYRRLGSLGAVGGCARLPACLWGARRGGARHFFHREEGENNRRFAPLYAHCTVKTVAEKSVIAYLEARRLS